MNAWSTSGSVSLEWREIQKGNWNQIWPRTPDDYLFFFYIYLPRNWMCHERSIRKGFPVCLKFCKERLAKKESSVGKSSVGKSSVARISFPAIDVMKSRNFESIWTDFFVENLWSAHSNLIMDILCWSLFRRKENVTNKHKPYIGNTDSTCQPCLKTHVRNDC